MANDLNYSKLYQSKGAAYKDSQVKSYSHYKEPIDHSPGRPAGDSRVWGDASHETQKASIDALMKAANEAKLSNREAAILLAIAKVESGFNPDAAAGSSSAVGLGQFTKATEKDNGVDPAHRYDVDTQARALVTLFIKNEARAQSRGQGEEYIYRYHHDGLYSKADASGSLGLKVSEKNVMSLVGEYEKFVQAHREAHNVLITEEASQAAEKVQQSPSSGALPEGRALLEEKLKICTPLVKAQLFEARGLDFDSQHGLRTTLAAIELGASHGIEPIQFVGINAQTKCLCVGNKLDGVMHSASMPTSAIGAVTHETAAAALVMALQSQQQESVQQAQMTVAQVPVQGR